MINKFSTNLLIIMKKDKLTFVAALMLIAAPVIQAESCPSYQNQARGYYNTREQAFYCPGDGMLWCCYTPPPCEE